MSPESSPASSGTPRDHVAAVAAGWIARQKAGLSAADRRELRVWLAADPQHAAAMALADPGASELDWPLYAGALDRVLEGLEARARKRRARRQKLVAVGAAALVIFGAMIFQPSRLVPPQASAALVVRTPLSQTLPDGSVVDLQEGAEIKIAFTATERRVQLVRGAAHFEVTKDPARPFLVTAGAITARAVGTAFLLGWESDQVALLVSEGKVAIDLHAPAQENPPGTSAANPVSTLALVQAGESVAVSRPVGSATTSPAAHAPSVSPLPAAEWDSRMGWRTPRLEFNGTALREVIERVNRHNRTQLVIADRTLDALKLSGALRADKIDALIEMLEADFRVTAERSEDRIVLRRAAR